MVSLIVYSFAGPVFGVPLEELLQREGSVADPDAVKIPTIPRLLLEFLEREGTVLLCYYMRSLIYGNWPETLQG